MVSHDKQNNDFEWHKYVRTAIHQRCEDRRKGPEDMRLRRLQRVQNFGRFKFFAGLADMAGFVSLLNTPFWYVWLALKWMGSGLRLCFDWVWLPLSKLVRQAIISPLTQPGLAPLLAILGLMTAGSTVAGAVTAGWDVHTIIAACLAVLFLLLAILPAFWYLLRGVQRLVSFKIVWPKTSFAIAGVLATAATGAAIIYTTPPLSWFDISEIDISDKPDCDIATSPEFVEGIAKAITGDTLQINDTIIKLAGIDAPELLQRCKNSRGRRWRCGRVARGRLARLTSYKPVKCKILNHRHRSHIKSGYCSVDGIDIGESLVKAGRVFAVGGFYARYDSIEKVAQEKKSGIWGGQAQNPQSYRDAAFERAKKIAPSGCPIKGHVSETIGKRYLMPWSPGYRRERVSKQHGERWFCSEEEAVAECWKPDPAS